MEMQDTRLCYWKPTNGTGRSILENDAACLQSLQGMASLTVNTVPNAHVLVNNM